MTSEELERLAMLTRLERNKEEDVRYSRELGEILEYVQRLAKIDTRGIPETDVVVQGFSGRKDELLPQDPSVREQILQNFPDSLAGALRVPAVFEKPKK